MLQAIQTKYLGPTNFRGSRVKAYCQAGSITIDWEHSLNPEDNHKHAVLELIKKLEWTGCGYACGWSPDGRGLTAVAIGKKEKIKVLDGFDYVLINCL